MLISKMHPNEQAIFKLVCEPPFIVGIQSGVHVSEEAKRIIRDAIGMEVDIVNVSGREELEHMAREEGVPGLLVGADIVEDISGFTAPLEARAAVRSSLKEKFRKYIDLIFRDLEFYEFLQSHPEIAISLNTLMIENDVSRENLTHILNGLRTLLPEIESLEVEKIADTLARDEVL
jgi:hypothetical protein